MHRYLSVVLSALLLGLPLLSHAADDALTTDQKRMLFRPCQTAASQERCEARQLAHYRAQAAHDPNKALELYDAMDLGKERLRNREKRERATENKRFVDATRKTYSQLQATNDVNTRRRDFLNELRVRRLACMTDAKPGLPRRTCLDDLANEMREKMKTPSAADPVTNQKTDN